MDRISTICSYLEKCNTFADVGCDHGYCSQYMLKNNLCEVAVISDVSAKSLKKAELLLDEYINAGKCRAVCCDGLRAVGNVEQLLIAGMGGEEIVKILKEGYIPEKFVFQPMKNAELLRKYLLENGCSLIVDDIFFRDGKFYFIIKGRFDGMRQSYTAAQLAFGRHSLQNPVFKEFLNGEINKLKRYLQSTMSDINRHNLLNKYNFFMGIYLDEIE